MSLNLPLAVTALEGAGLVFLQSLSGKPLRNIAGLVAQVTPVEEHLDELTITQHPVEQGAAISDHAYKNPARVILEVGWSNSPTPSNTDLASLPSNILGGLAATLDGFGSSSSYINDIYNQLLALQETRMPFNIVTGKRTYTSMLIKSLSTTTDPKTENAILLRVSCQQIIIVQTQVVKISAAGLKYPQATSPVQDTGTKQPASAPFYNPTGVAP